MNKHIKLALIFAAAALAGTGCTVDDYNDAYLDGFDSDQEVTDIQTVSYTLTDADYSSVANNAANKAIAEAAGPEAVEALAAVGTAKCFSEAAPGIRIGGLQLLPVERFDGDGDLPQGHGTG